MCDTTTTTDPGPDYAALAAGGASTLDARSDRWWHLEGGYDKLRQMPLNPISLDHLNMAGPESCVLGQAYGEWADAPLQLQGLPSFFVQLPCPAFRAPADVWARYRTEVDAAYAALTKAWRELIKARRDADQ
jgi:hypothetical protein